MLLPLLIIPVVAFFISVSSTKLESERLIIALAFSLLNFMHANLLVALFDPTLPAFQFLTGSGLLGIDGVSLLLVWLVTLLMPIVLLSFDRVVILLVIGFWSVAVFLVLDFLYFYIAFEGVLIPMFFLIGFYGGLNRKIKAAYSFFLFTLLGSLLLFLALLLLYCETGDTGFEVLLATPFSYARQRLLWLAFFLSLAIKIPQVPFHLWLIEAHVEAPTAASVLLAAILLKLGTYGFIRFSLPFFPEASNYFAPALALFAILAVIYSSLATLAQLDLKKIIAYSSIAHMNFALVGLFSNHYTAIATSFYFLISHGLISAGLFLLIGLLYDRLHTRTIKYFKGLVMISPLFTLMLLLFTFANAAVPATSGFIAEFYILVGVAFSMPWFALFISLAILLTPAYGLLLFHRIAYGQIGHYITTTLFADLTTLEFHLLFTLLSFTLIFGIFPNQIFALLHYSTLKVIWANKDCSMS